jgi:hypothetical protein
MFLEMKGSATPFKPSKQKGAHPPSGTPGTFMTGNCAEKVITFFNNIYQTKNGVWG